MERLPEETLRNKQDMKHGHNLIYLDPWSETSELNVTVSR